MNRCITLSVTLFAVVFLFSDLKALPFEFGKISAEDMDLEYYREKYPDDFAVMIGDHGKSSIVRKSGRYRHELERTYRIMILDARGFSLGDLVFSCYSSGAARENIKRFRANVYNLQDGKIVRTRVRYRDGHTEDKGENWSEMKYALPGIKQGTVFEVKYTFSSGFIDQVPPWYFQYTYPVEYSEYEINICGILRYRNFFLGFVGLEESCFDDGVKHYLWGTQKVYTNPSFTWRAINVPAFRIEPYTDNYRNYMASMHFDFAGTVLPVQNTGNMLDTWENVSKVAYKHVWFGGYLSKAKGVVSAEIPFEKSEQDLTTTLNHALKAMREHVAWNSRLSAQAYRSPEEVLSSGVGNSAEINLLLCAMLQNNGIDANPVLLKSRGNGALYSDSPTLKFNYIIVGVKDENQNVVLMDAAQRRLPAGFIPGFAINGRGRLVWEEGSHWVLLENPGLYHEKRTYDLVLNHQGSLDGTFNFRFYGQGKVQLDDKVYSKGAENIFEEIGEELDISIISPHLELSGSSDDPAVISGGIELENFVSGSGNEIFLEAMLFETITSHEFQLSERKYPVFFDRKSLKEIEINLKLPEGVVVEELPGPKIIKWSNNMIYEYESSYEDGMLTLSAKNLLAPIMLTLKIIAI